MPSVPPNKEAIEVAKHIVEDLKKVAEAAGGSFDPGKAIPLIVEDLEKRLRLPDQFFDKLFEQDDWTFVIKGHALLDAAMNEAIINAVGRRALARYIDRLPVTNGGRLDLAIDLDLVDKSIRPFVQRFNAIRNECAHSIRSVEFSFTTHLEQIGPQKVRELRDAVGLGGFVIIKDGEFEAEPKRFMAGALQAVLASFNVQSRLWFMRQATMQVYLMTQPAAEMPRLLWNIVKDGPPDLIQIKPQV